VKLRFGIQHRGGNNRLNHVLGDRVAKVRVRNFFAVLRGHNHATHARRAAVAVLDGDLRLSIRPEKINFIGFANLGEALREAMGELDRHGHQFLGFIAGEPKHQALVARSTGIHAHGDVRRLPLHHAHDGAGIRVVAVLRAIVADAANGAAYQLVVIDLRAGGDFTSDYRHAGGDERFASHAPLGVVLHNLVKDSVRNLVGNFVRMALGYGFRRK
jgi:hypothetical protein